MDEAMMNAIKVAVAKVWPRVVLPRLREEFKSSLNKVSVHRRIKEMANGRLSFVDPWAFVRVKDERKTLLASLNSILPVIKKGVIAYNDCTDGSDLIVKEFCERNPGFIPYEYPFYVEPAGSIKYSTGELLYENTLAAYYNAVMDQIPRGEWLVKVDVDQIYFPEILKHSFSLPKKKSDAVMYSRLNVVRDPFGELRVLGYVRPGDHWLIYNDGNLKFENVYLYDDNGGFQSYELLRHSRLSSIYKPECSSVHFPFEKEYRVYSGGFDGLMDFASFVDSFDGEEISRDLLRADEVSRSQFE